MIPKPAQKREKGKRKKRKATPLENLTSRKLNPSKRKKSNNKEKGRKERKKEMKETPTRKPFPLIAKMKIPHVRKYRFRKMEQIYQRRKAVTKVKKKRARSKKEGQKKSKWTLMTKELKQNHPQTIHP